MNPGELGVQGTGICPEVTETPPDQGLCQGWGMASNVISQDAAAGFELLLWLPELPEPVCPCPPSQLTESQSLSPTDSALSK